MNSSRLIPITVAGVICFFTAFLLGAVFWYFFGSSRLTTNDSEVVVQTSNQNSAISNTDTVIENTNVNASPVPTAAPEIKKAPAGEVEITDGEVTLGGEIRLPSKEDIKVPLRRVSVSAFSMSETEVTNEQYAEFIKAAKHKSPKGWKNDDFSPRDSDEPVSGITFADANAYCEWLSGEIGAKVRLPSEAEWIRAARGDTDYKYPWGNEWNDKAAPSTRKIGEVFPVKSLSEGRSPFGVYAMVGNVWEWTSDLAVDEFNKPILFNESKLRIIKGGSAFENDRQFLTIDARLTFPENEAFEMLGFRYVIVR